MKQSKPKQQFGLKPGEKIPLLKLEALKTANKTYSKSRDFTKYLNDLKVIFEFQEIEITSESKLFLAGFIEGEGSISISIKKLESAKFGVLIDPMFNITQHVNGFSTLYLALKTFRTGRIQFKSGSNATLVLGIENRQTLEDKIIPFYERYVVPFGSTEKIRRLNNLKTFLSLLKANAHKDLDSISNKILPIWDEMRVQRGYKGETFRNLEEAKKYISNFRPK